MKKIFSVLLALLIVGCSKPPIKSARIIIKGSDTMLRLTQLLAEEYMKDHPGVSIYIEGGGTTEGIASLIKGEIDICTASRNLTAEEMQIMAKKYNKLGIKYLLAKDALSIYLNKNNSVTNLTINQLKAIYRGTITNWKELDGKDFPIIPINRPPNSGTHLYFKQHVLKGNSYSNKLMVEPTTQRVIEQVKDNPYAIGYGGIGYGKSLIHASINNIKPTVQNAQEDKYPLTRYLYFVILKTHSKQIKNFVDWVLSIKGQNMVKKAGYIPLWKLPY